MATSWEIPLMAEPIFILNLYLMPPQSCFHSQKPKCFIAHWQKASPVVFASLVLHSVNEQHSSKEYIITAAGHSKWFRETLYIIAKNRWRRIGSPGFQILPSSAEAIVTWFVWEWFCILIFNNSLIYLKWGRESKQNRIPPQLLSSLPYSYSHFFPKFCIL